MIFCPDPRHKCRGNSRVRDDQVLQTFGSDGARKGRVVDGTDRPRSGADGSDKQRVCVKNVSYVKSSFRPRRGTANEGGGSIRINEKVLSFNFGRGGRRVRDLGF